jgi:beta-glucosidase
VEHGRTLTTTAAASTPAAPRTPPADTASAGPRPANSPSINAPSPSTPSTTTSAAKAAPHTPPSPSSSNPAPTNPAALLSTLTLEQKIGLLTGADNFSLPGQPAIGLRALVMSDGPAGVRGTVLDPADPSSSLPAPIALAAAWDPDLVERVAEQLGIEARAKGVDVLLAPTVNLVRTPFGGRGFECFGEDPVLAARIAAAFVRGLQSAGVAATTKHYVGNDSETDRWAVDARIDETTLRELYLVPFEACVTEGDTALVMAGYNKVNGATMTEHTELLRRILKDEWGFAGAVVSDWFAARSTEATALAGLDLVMPGPDGPWGTSQGGPLAEAVARGDVPESDIDDKALRLLRLAHRVGALRAAPSGTAASGDRSDGAALASTPMSAPHSALASAESGTVGSTVKAGPQADRAVLRAAAAASFVLLRNSPATLPLAAGSSIALLGPNAFAPQYQGLGSAQVGMGVRVCPEEGLRAALPPDAKVTVAQGCRTWLNTPVPAPGRLTDPTTGQAGARLEVHGENSMLRYTDVRERPEVTWWDPNPEVTAPGISRLTFHTSFHAETSGPHRFAAAGLGKLELQLGIAGPDGRDTTVSGTAPRPLDPVEPLSRPFEIGAELDLEPGDRVDIFASCDPTGYASGFTRFKLGVIPMPEEDVLIKEAIAAAESSDVAIIVVGSAQGIESEGYDRGSLSLPGRQDELISAVAAVNRRTVVVVNSGMPMLMPWADEVCAILQVWFPGQEFGHALADVLFGVAEPGGRLPVTLPRSEAACPVGPAIPVGDVLEYAERLLVGYRGYDAAEIEPLYPFGHGRGYTSWTYEELDVPVGIVRAHADVEVTVNVRNVGTRPGRETVQVYLSEPHGETNGDTHARSANGADDAGSAGRPVRVLAGLGTACAEPGESVHVRLRLPSRAFARWDPDAHAWVHPHGTYTVHVGRSSRDLRLSAHVVVSG